MSLPDPVAVAVLDGYAVVPAGDKPKVAWSQWNNERQTQEEAQMLGHGSRWAVITGELYGFVVLDFDGPEGLETMASLGLEPHVRSASGGAHVYVKHPGHYVSSSAKAFPQYPGLDIKGERSLAYFSGISPKAGAGEYMPVQWPPQPIELPVRLVEELFPHPQDTARPADRGTWSGPGAGTPEARRYVDKAAQDVRNAEPGTSNAILNKVTFTVAGLVASGSLDHDYAWESLYLAAQERDCGDIEDVMGASWDSGARKPWRLETFEEEYIPHNVYRQLEERAVPDAIPFPIDVFPPEIEEFIRQGSDAVSCPPDYLGAGVLATFGTAIGGHVELQITSSWRESSNLYVCMVGEPGVRKSPALGLLMSPVWDYENTMDDEWEARRMRAEDEEEAFDEDQQSIVVDDATIEALFGVLEQNPRGIVLSADELSGWVRGMGQYKGGLGRDRQHWLSIWSRNPIKVHRVKGRNRKVRKPFVTVIGGIQPDPLEDLLNGKDDGLLPRLLMAQGESITPKLKRDALSDEIAGRYAETWHGVRDRGEIERIVTFTESGYRAFERWANEHYVAQKEVPPALVGAFAKMDGQCARVCLILAELEDSAVTEDIVAKSVRVIDYFKGQGGKILQSAGAGSPWEKQQRTRLYALARYLKQNPGADKNDLIGAFTWATSRTIDPLLDDLRGFGVWND